MDNAPIRIRVKIRLELSKEFESWCAPGSVLLSLVFAIVVDVVTKSMRNELMSEMLYMDDLVLKSETMEGLRKNF